MPQAFPHVFVTPASIQAPGSLADAIRKVTRPVYCYHQNGRPAWCHDARLQTAGGPPEAGAYPLLALAPALHPADLGSAEFKNRRRLRFAYLSGAMAHGISSVELVAAAARAGMMGFFGAAGLSLPQLEHALDRLAETLGRAPYGVNLVYGADDQREQDTVNLFLHRGVRLISAAGYLKLTLPLIRFRLSGIHRRADGRVVCPNSIIAKTSRLEIAAQFLSPPPPKLTAQLASRKLITREAEALARFVPVADDLTAEADSGGHTDNRSALCLLPAMLALRDELTKRHAYPSSPCIGLGGGVGTPLAVCAAFALGAEYVLAGSIHQACLESGTSPVVRKMLAEASQTDTIMAPSANLFERGAKVQVLKQGVLFPQRAARLLELYRDHDSLEAIPQDIQKDLETQIFKMPLTDAWEATRRFFETQDPAQIVAAEKDPKRRMALVFRSYLGRSPKWAIAGEMSRKKDFQIWCGPSMGAFNEWTRGSFLALPENRDFQTVAMNLMLGACVAFRRQWLHSDKCPAPAFSDCYRPLTISEMNLLLDQET